MAKLYFKYGVMGSSKSAHALLAKFNYEEKGSSVWLIKPFSSPGDDGFVRSVVGLEAKAEIISRTDDLYENFITGTHRTTDVIIADECQFFTEDQIDALRRIVDEHDIPVLCYGLRTDFLTRLFPGSRRLLELADSIAEIKTVCRCGHKATVNARIDSKGDIVTVGDQVFVGGGDSYDSMCYRCWKDKIKSQQERKNKENA
ncbi:MAG: thymidine kinase [Acutalibacteraceae bacterium]|jgi:thymidine kinase